MVWIQDTSGLSSRGKNAYEQNNDSAATILGQDQWTWLETSISNSIADVIIILSSIQILATNHPYENGTIFLRAKKLLELIANASNDKKLSL